MNTTVTDQLTDYSKAICGLNKPLKVAMVAGETSGDILGAGLIAEIKHHNPNACCYGIGGSLMKKKGFNSIFPMERLSVMGLFEVLGRLKELIKMRRQLRDKLFNDPPDVFIGIDAPDFNLGLEKQLKAKGIPTVHYVSPQVWAWREGRVKKIQQSIDHMLVLLPFEARYYKNRNIDVTFVGHPLADKVDWHPDKKSSRISLGILNKKSPVIGLLPGSRKTEVARLGEVFLETARLLKKKWPDACFIAACANAQRKDQLQNILTSFKELNVKLYVAQSSQVMAASDAILIASGTATLEAALHKRPLVVSYRMNPLTFAIVRRLVKVDHVALPNLLVGRELVPELLQENATPEKLYAAMEKVLIDRVYQAEITQSFELIHHQLKRNASQLAYGAVKSLIEERISNAS
ncbi:MAG: lipid-A-disaccharide synthase [Endozoicomonas sp. (ex Botrylloides leachii)]|nr:lipid-A-disaccharide synthase [Endozoicomonas sp. (ex Botrylloides leachii)]